MGSPTFSKARQRELVAAWQETGCRLEALRFAELATQTPSQSAEAAFDMLQLGGMLPANTARERSSGLIEMQRHFARWHGRGQP